MSQFSHISKSLQVSSSNQQIVTWGSGQYLKWVDAHVWRYHSPIDVLLLLLKNMSSEIMFVCVCAITHSTPYLNNNLNQKIDMRVGVFNNILTSRIKIQHRYGQTRMFFYQPSTKVWRLQLCFLENTHKLYLYSLGIDVWK